MMFMLDKNPKKLAIACSSGSFKGAFAHGVLSALETAKIRANGYAVASSSVIPMAMRLLGEYLLFIDMERKKEKSF
jgi:hypothetical protein